MKAAEGLRLVMLHSHPEYMEDCMNILNEQWPRSRSLRMRTFSASCDQFPTSLVLLNTCAQGTTQVIGHSKLNILPQEQNSGWVESVIIRRELRGAGYGRHLMNKTEEYARSCGFITLYLSTHDQQVFYGKLGYEFCPPVSIYGGTVNRHLLPKQFIMPQITKGVQGINLNGNAVETNQKPHENIQHNTSSPNIQRNTASPVSTTSPSMAPPPPPPPPPPASSKLTKEHITRIDPTKMSKMYMKKDL